MEIKLEVGKSYRCDGGNKINILFKHEFSNGIGPCDFIGEIEGTIFVFRIRNKDGKFKAFGLDNIESTIVEEWIYPPFNLESGQYYKTRDGRKVYIGYESLLPPSRNGYKSYIGEYTEIDNLKRASIWYEHGRTHEFETITNDDLVSKWSE